MNVEELISSGLLESYVAGTATSEEIRLVQQMEKKYPEVREEIERIETVYIGYAESITGKPSAETGRKIRERIFQEKARVPARTAVVPIASGDPARVLRFAVAASLVFFLISSVINFILYERLNAMKAEMAELNAEKSVLAEQFRVQQTSLRQMDEEMGMLMKPGNMMIALKGLDLSPASSAMVLWNPDDKSVYINVASLPEPPAGMQYQLWALMDGKPVDAGVFNVGGGAAHMQKMKDMAAAQAFAVTLEKAGGSPSPTMEAMYLIGNV